MNVTLATHTMHALHGELMGSLQMASLFGIGQNVPAEAARGSLLNDRGGLRGTKSFKQSATVYFQALHQEEFYIWG